METKCISNFARVLSCKDGKLSAVASDATVDRDNEVVLPSAFTKHLDRYKANPVILAAHTHRSLDGSPTIIGSASDIKADDKALTFDMSFAKTPLAQQWQSLFEDGHARAFSIGFIPMNGEWKKSPDNQVALYVHTEVELLEISAVAVPANPNAVARDFDPKELERLVDARIKKALELIYAHRMLSLIGD